VPNVTEQVHEDLWQEAIGHDPLVRAVVPDHEVWVAGDQEVLEPEQGEGVVEGARGVDDLDDETGVRGLDGSSRSMKTYRAKVAFGPSAASTVKRISIARASARGRVEPSRSEPRAVA